jgi:hypothetical protein
MLEYRSYVVPPEEIAIGDDVFMPDVDQWRMNVDAKCKRGGKHYIKFEGDFYYVLLKEDEDYLIVRKTKREE